MASDIHMNSSSADSRADALELCGFKLSDKGHTMDLKRYGDIPYLCFPVLDNTGLVKSLFSTRDGGVSSGCWRSMNLSFTRGDDPEAVHENYRRIAEIFASTPEHMVLSFQTHTVNVRRVTEEDAGKGVICSRDYTDVDGLVTNVRGLILSTFHADCVPLYFLDPVHRAIGLSHSGRRGTAGRMGAATIAKMREDFGTDPGDIIACIGPSICSSCYEVGPEVAEEFMAEFPEPEYSGFLTRKHIAESPEADKYLLDLWEANRVILRSAGVADEHIHCGGVCTCCNPDRLFSHRRMGEKRGNAGAFLMLL